MPHTITIADADRILRSRSALLERGASERDVSGAVASGSLIRVRRGWYVDAGEWAELWKEGRHLVRVRSVQRDSSYAASPFCLESAAVIHGLPLYGPEPTVVHTLVGPTSHSRAKAGVARHAFRLDPGDVVEVHGLRCTSLDRTVLDLAQRTSPEGAVVTADAALRRIAVRGHRQDERIATQWRDGLLDRAARIATRGVRQARRVIAFADGRAQLPGESVSRLQLHRLGFRDLDLQARAVGPDGEEFWMDFAFPAARAFGEFDGMGKYLDVEMRGDRTPGEVVLAEKRREDAIRGVTGWRVVRWGFEHIRTPEALGARLAAFGIRP